MHLLSTWRENLKRVGDHQAFRAAVPSLTEDGGGSTGRNLENEAQVGHHRTLPLANIYSRLPNTQISKDDYPGLSFNYTLRFRIL